MLDARFPVNPERGRYDCRWYSSVEGDELAEVAHATIHNPVPMTASGCAGRRLAHDVILCVFA
jgi:hypothetical protein